MHSTHLLSADSIALDWSPARVGRRIVVLPEIDSTNTYVLDEAIRHGASAADGLVAFAERQTAGRGRLGRAWQCPTGAGLMFSILLGEPAQSATAAGWMMVAGVAVAQGIANATDIEPRLRWPNDLYVEGRKLAGILVETRAVGADGHAVAIGVGINCLQQPAHFPDELRNRAVSLDMLSRSPIDRAIIARSVLSEFDRCMQSSLHVDEASLVELWRERSADIGARVTLREGDHSFAGTVIDIHPREGLLLQLDHGGRRQFDPAKTTR